MLGLLLQQNEGMNAFDRNIFRDVGKEAGAGASSGGDAMPPPSATPEGGPAEPPAALDAGDGEGDSGKLPHVVVIYLVNPVLEQESEGRARLSLLALFRAYLATVSGLPKSLLPFVQLEIVDLKTVLDCSAPQEREEAKYVDTFSQLDGERRLGPGERVWERRGVAATLRSLALSVYTQPRNLSPAALSASKAKCLTGLGPTASYLQTVHSRLKSDAGTVYRMYSPPYVLPPPRPVREIGQTKGLSHEEGGSVLYVSYCLSEKQQWLLATATDETGSLLDNSLINISTVDIDRQAARPNDVIRQALAKLWSFVIGVLATGCHPWRLVIGRLGRVGHGELRGWAQLLAKPNLKKTSSIMRDACPMCARTPGHEASPTILSAALVSLEAEASLRLLPHIFKHDERFGHTAKALNLSTPEDASATHILVFPTSATAQPGAPSFADEDYGEDGFDFALGDNFADEEIGGMTDIMELGMGPNDAGLGPLSSARPGFAGFFTSDARELDVNMQPLASGFLISTAPAPGLPTWFWMGNASAARRRSPVHLRAALHLHTSRVMEDDLGGFGGEPTSAKPRAASDKKHPLDSGKPPDVLRYANLSDIDMS